MGSCSYDTIVVGVGGHGSAACYHLAKSGAKVLGLERFHIGHELGSSHGDSRIIRRELSLKKPVAYASVLDDELFLRRLAYKEGPWYVPLLRRSYALWHELEQESQQVRSAVHVQSLFSSVELHSSFGPVHGRLC